MAVEALRRERDGSVYAYRCTSCGGAWKVYQKPAHLKEGCANEKPTRAQEREVRSDTDKTLASVGVAPSRRAKPRRRRA